MPAWSLKFVQAIASSPTVRLNIHDKVTYRWVGEGTDLSAPELKRSVVSTLLRDGEAVPASAYANRVLVLPILVSAASQDALATAIQALDAEVNRATNTLLLQKGTTPFFFRTFRSPDYTLEHLPYNKARVVLRLLAEPFAYGNRVDLAPVTVNNNPAAGSNPCYWDVTGVAGDVETPAMIAFTSAIANQQCVLGIRRRGTPSNILWSYQAETTTAGFSTDTAPFSGDAAMSGGGGLRTTFTTAAEARRFGMYVARNSTYPSDPTTNDARGTYRVFARVRKSVAGDTIKIRLQDSVVTTNYITDKITLPNTASPCWIDMGLVQLPASGPPENDGYGNPLAVLSRIYNFMAERTAGTGVLDVDVFQLVPADDALLLATLPPSSGVRAVFDGPNDAVYTTSLTPPYNVGGSPPCAYVGSIPKLSPGETNRLVFLQRIGATTPGTGDGALTDTASITVSYWPRYLYV